MIDPITESKRLTEAGIPPEQADAIVRLVAEAQHNPVLEQLRAIRSKLDSLDARLAAVEAYNKRLEESCREMLEENKDGWRPGSA